MLRRKPLLIDFLMKKLILLLTLFAGLVSAHAEFRGAWVASVFNIDFPSRPGLDPATQRQEIVSMLEVASRARLNALLVQVRPEGDALYASSLEPWSRFLTGRQGGSPGFDPLKFFIEEGRKRGIGIHAWLNPYRAATSASDSRDSLHVSKRLAAYTKRAGRLLWMDPGALAVQDHVVNVVRDLLRRYDLAGIHIDDYFYPYPESGGGAAFPDSDTYAAYQRVGGTLGKADWRRNNVNTLVRRLHDAVKQEKSGAVFGVSPFGIYTKGQPADVKAGLDQFNELYADPVKWMREGWVDYLAPQLYWKEGGPQSFSALLRWWRSPSVNPRGIPIYAGIALERLEGTHNWPVTEIATQLRLEKTIGPRATGGFILYHIKPLQKNLKGSMGVISRG